MFAHTDESMPTRAENFIRTILVVEDEEPIRMFLSEFLQDDGYRVIEAANVAEAKDLLIQTAVDVVFSDVNMPGSETGFALEKWVRRHYPDTKVLLASGFPHAPECTRDLLEPLMAKPYRMTAVVQRIEGLFSRREPSALKRDLAVA
jgi:DNA-binding NtrC family response regulator